jgi:hypothetical protein
VTILAVAPVLAQTPAAPGGFDPPKLPSGAASVEHIKVHGKSLEGSLEGDSAERDVTIDLPPI